VFAMHAKISLQQNALAIEPAEHTLSQIPQFVKEIVNPRASQMIEDGVFLLH
jgi:hypothetical protein